MATFYDESPKCVLYKFVYDPYGLQFYLDRHVNCIYKTFIHKYRLSSHSLSIETGRFYNIERNKIHKKANIYESRLKSRIFVV